MIERAAWKQQGAVFYVIAIRVLSLITIQISFTGAE